MPTGSRTVPNGIDVAEIASKASDARWTRSDMRPVIAMISRLDAIKDHATLLHAYSLLQKQMPEAQLWIIGDGVLRAALEKLAIHLGIASSTLFLDSRTDIPNLLSQIDVFAFSTTRDEGFGIVLIEAMAAGVPVVASDVAACREVLAGGEAGTLVPPADPEAMAQALQFIFDNTSERRRIAEAAMSRVRREYSVEICARRWETMLFEMPKPSPRLSECAS
jgi:glycosyltransferase involved in cell wall biosynthesis